MGALARANETFRFSYFPSGVTNAVFLMASSLRGYMGVA